MKQFNYLVLAIMFALPFSFISCGDDSKEVTEDASKYLGYSYSDLTPEEQKEKLEEDALAFLSEIEGLKDNEALTILKAFNDLLSINSPDIELESYDELAYTQLTGEYTWSSSREKWDFADGEQSGTVKFLFPVKNKSAEIVATIVPSSVDYTVSDGYEEYGEDGWEWIETETIVRLPKEASIKIYSGNTEVGSIQASSEIKDTESIPALTKLAYNLGEYTMTTTVTKGNPSIVSSVFKKGNTVLIDATVNVSGDVDQLLDEENEPEGISGNTVIKIKDNLAFVGKTDLSKYQEALNKASDERNKNEESSGWEKANEEYTKAFSEAFNDYFELYLVSLSDQTKIARLESQVKSETDFGYTYWDEVYILRFNDDTVREAETFFSSGFEEFLEELEKFLENF
jgi:hypothetical protein